MQGSFHFNAQHLHNNFQIYRKLLPLPSSKPRKSNPSDFAKCYFLGFSWTEKQETTICFFLISFGGTPEKACWLTNSRRVIQFPNFSVIQGASRSGKMWNISFASFSVPFRNAKLKPEPKKKHEAWRHDMQWICCTTNKLGGIDTSNKKCYYVKHLF